ncbi:MAG: NYN domain-containing protein [Oscillospiraceae bacterium]|nr:NYN domain-containing protein [Oscillospiraceae bacterium]
MNVAILIDSENVDPSHAEQIFTHAASLGSVTVKEIYGAGIALNEWSGPILQYAIHMNMTLRPNRFKNSSDIALVIGAMDLLSERMARRSGPVRAEGVQEDPCVVDTVVIASSDSDFSALAIRLRTAGVNVVGMGDAEKTNPTWPLACSSFVPFAADAAAPEPLRPQSKPARNQPQARQQPQSQPKPQVQPQPQPLPKPQPQQNQPQSQPKPQQQSQPQPKPQPKPEPDYALTHAARVENIRAFISAQLLSNEGKMRTDTLMNLLNALPDYRYDQQHSKRRPLDYLSRQYGESFKFTRGEDGVSWTISAASSQPALAPAAELETKQETEPEPEAEPTKPDSSGEETPEPKETPEAPIPTGAQDSAAVFAAAGVPEEISFKILQICGGSPNIRIIYNKLRKSFGAKDGRKFFQLVKSNPAAFRKSPKETAESREEA